MAFTIPAHLMASYREEAAENVAELETALLELERNPADAETIDRVFRGLHTIKGSAGMFGLEELASFTHEVETTFHAVREGTLGATRELISLALEAKDFIRLLLEGSSTSTGVEGRRLIGAFRAFVAGGREPGPRPSTGRPLDAAAEIESGKTFRVRFRPHPDLFQDGTNVLGLLAELRSLGRYEAVARTESLPPLEELDPERCHLGWDIVLATDRGPNAVLDAFIFVEGRCQLQVEVADDAASAEGDTRLGRILVARGDVSDDAVERAVAERKRIGDVLRAEGLVSPEAIRAAVAEQRVVREQRERRGPAPAPVEVTSSIRVAASKLDRLVDEVGELVIAQARLTRIAARLEDPELLSVSEEIERLSSELRDGTLDVRMVPIGTTFGRFKRLVHDLSAELGKEIDLVTEGAGTDLDKSVIERLGDPLVHLIRNCCDHGIGSPEVRRAAGKPARGTVRLSARQSGSSVVIEVADDGAGLDAEAIRQKALERALIGPDARLSEKDLFNLVFLPGFSTARSVSTVSGRGVGMDVVKRAIEGLRGTVTLESAAGAGTTVRIQLPLTLVIIDGLLVSVGDGSYVFPLSAVEECLELGREDFERAHGAHLVTVRGEQVPYLRLRELFGLPGERPDTEIIAVVRHPEGRCGFAVDQVIGQHQIVIKSLGQMCRGAKGLSGATILGDGTVALILDLPALVRNAMSAV